MKKSKVLESKHTDHLFNQIKILKMLDHPFIVKFKGFSQDEKFLYLAFDIINGGEFFSHLRKNKKLSIEEAK